MTDLEKILRIVANDENCEKYPTKEDLNPLWIKDYEEAKRAGVLVIRFDEMENARVVQTARTFLNEVIISHCESMINNWENK